MEITLSTDSIGEVAKMIGTRKLMFTECNYCGYNINIERDEEDDRYYFIHLVALDKNWEQMQSTERAEHHSCQIAAEMWLSFIQKPKQFYLNFKG